ncbi:bifunctional DNA primase/polymerase [Microbacterium sp.]|uniref:bifunctional DNA primase/polymerase n=1 Tax=Microbacterium sp. TaxID=51671 RepID=UPI003A90735A
MSARKAKPTTVDIALSLAAAGWYVFPWNDALGKGHVRWTEDATTDEGTVRRWWNRWPKARLAVHAGMSSLVLVDLDVKHGKDGIARVGDAGLPLPTTLSYTSRSGSGEHHIYRAPEGVELAPATDLNGMEGVDIRSGNGVIFYAGGVLSKADLRKLAPAPEWALVHKGPGDYDAADVEAWLAAETKPDATGRTMQAVENVPVRGLGNGGLIPALTPIVSSMKRPWGRREAYDAALERYMRGYPWDERDPYPRAKYTFAFDRAWGKAISRVDDDRQKEKERKVSEDKADEGQGTKASGSTYEIAQALYQQNWDTKITPDGRPFAVHRVTGLATLLSDKGRGGALFHLLQVAYLDKMAKPGSAEQVSQVLLAEHALALSGRVPTAELHLRSARPTSGRVVLDLGERNSSAHVVVTGKGWSLREGAPRVTFERSQASRPLPRPVRPAGMEPGDGHEALRGLLGWGENDRRWLLVRGWLVAALLPNVARPLLFLHGSAGSGKSLRGVFVVSVLDPRGELGGNFNKDERDSMVTASARYLVGWDNITTVSEAVSNMICRLVTGGTDERRSLYSDDDLHVRDIRRTGALTGINIPIMLPDALERIIPLECGVIPERRRRSEAAMRTRFNKAHPAILADVLDDLSTVLGQLPRVQRMKRNRPRMADFSDVLRALGREYDAAYVRTVKGVRREVAESDPFVGAVVQWLTDSPALLGQRMTATDVLVRLQASTRDRADIPGFPKQPNGLSALLAKHTGSIEAMGFTVKSGIVRGTSYWTFSAVGVK